jgi:hypothetical protein
MRVMSDEEVDIFPTVRHIHSVRPQAVSTEVRKCIELKLAQILLKVNMKKADS